MDLGQMSERCGDNYKLLGVAVLEGWEFYINNRHKANIAVDSVDPNAVVYGLLFEINEVARNSLDKYEGYSKVPKVYSRIIENISFNGKFVKAWVYFDTNNLMTGKSDITDYLYRIIKVAEKFNFPKPYITHLKSFI